MFITSFFFNNYHHHLLFYTKIILSYMYYFLHRKKCHRKSQITVKFIWSFKIHTVSYWLLQIQILCTYSTTAGLTTKFINQSSKNLWTTKRFEILILGTLFFMVANTIPKIPGSTAIAVYYFQNQHQRDLYLKTKSFITVRDNWLPRIKISFRSILLHSIVGQQYVSGWVLTQINDVGHHEEKCPHYRDGKAFSSS